VTTPDQQEASLNTMMVKASREVVAVLDASKLGQRSLAVIAPIADLDVVITDTAASAADIQSLRDQGVEVIVV
jgi:DeoR family transcriptional regulator of aga operon